MTAAQSPSNCTVVGAKLLPASSGGSDALCKAVSEAAAKADLKPGYRIAVEVGKRQSLQATLTLADGRRLPPLRFDLMDSQFSQASFRHFADDLMAYATASQSR